MEVRVEAHQHLPVVLVPLQMEACPYCEASMEALILGEEREGKFQEVACLQKHKLHLNRFLIIY